MLNLEKEEKSDAALLTRFTTKDLERRQSRYRRTTLKRRAATASRRVTGSLPEPQRVIDATLAMLVLTMTLPLMAALRLICGPIRKPTCVGRDYRPFTFYTFVTKPGSLIERLHLHRLPTLWNIVRGDMAFIGPRAARPNEMPPRDRVQRERYAVRPGLICLWWVRQRANIAFDGEACADRDYVFERSVWGDLGILLRAVWTAFYGVQKAETITPGRITVLDLPIDNDTINEAVAVIGAKAQAPAPADGPMQVSFINADCANLAARDFQYRKLLQERSHYNLADGIGLKLAGKLLGRPVRENVNGTDLFPRLCEALSGTPGSIYLLGGKPGIAEGVANWVRANHPGVRIAGMQHGYFERENEAEVLENIRESGATILMVAFGAPRQEKWIAAHRHELQGVRVAMGVGGLFDFYSGQKSRAPQWVREMGMEWVFRLMLEPGRLWKRYVVGNSVFLARVLIERTARKVRRKSKRWNGQRMATR